MDIFEFWNDVQSGEPFHPKDHDVLNRVRHGFDSRCLPVPFAGPLRTAPVVLLYLNPSAGDFETYRSPAGEKLSKANLCGDLPLWAEDQYPGGYKWLSSQIKLFGKYRDLQAAVAIMNICPYSSPSFVDTAMLAALPSSRICLEWTQQELFPAAVRGDRIVICRRAHRSWGLEPGYFEGSLFSPHTVRSAHMRKGEMRNRIVETVKHRLTRYRPQ